MKKTRILIIEDDINILLGLEDNLIEEGYEVCSSKHGKEGYNVALDQNFDLIILDLMLPGMNGFEICKKLKKLKPIIPIVMLTARDSELDKVTGLDFGADDYITKPFGLSELLARIRAVLRRAYPQEQTLIDYKFGQIHIHFVNMVTLIKDAEVKFTKKEYEIMKYFILHEGEVVHRHDLLEHVWGFDYMPTTRTVDNFVLEIRKKIEEVPSSPKYITSISGVGYKFDSGN
jgi:two-component system alkaline phosphatase synthesis response regulator PhoP